jgi:hypothetical protein
MEAVEIEHRFFGYAARSTVTKPTELQGLCGMIYYSNKNMKANEVWTVCVLSL